MHYADAALVEQVLADHRTAPIPERLRAMLGFLEKLTKDPGSLGPEDLLPLRAHELTDRAIAEAIYVATMFNLMDRLADTFDFALPTDKDRQTSVTILTRIGYGAASIPG